MGKSLLIAFAMYSKIPVPNVEWDKKSMRLALCFFPLIGLVIGLCFWVVYKISIALAFGNVLKGALLTVVPVFITGGIHADGFIDTTDAISSFQSWEKRLEILKDPHVGAFGIICTVIYFLLYFGFASELGEVAIVSVCGGFVISRALSAICAVSIKGARENGLLATFSNGANKKVVVIASAMFTVIAVAISVANSAIIGVVTVALAALTCIYYRNFVIKNFGGVTGDLAGYFLQVTEIIILIGAVIMQRVAM